MKLIIHRGTHQIGGSIVEVSTAKTRLILDVGLPLDDLIDPDRAKRVSQPKLDPLVAKLFSRPVDAVLLSHAHADHSGLLKQVPKGTKLCLSRGISKMLMAGAIYAGQVDIRHLNERRLEPGKPCRIGEIRVTPFAVDHSAFDSLAFLLEADGKRMLYTGDLRLHGRKPGMAKALVGAVTRQPLDVLVIEGTNLSPNRVAGRTEHELEAEVMRRIQAAPGLVLAAFSPMHIDRLVTFYRATLQANRKLVLDVYGAFVLHLAAGQAKLPKPQTCPRIRVYYNRSRPANSTVERLFKQNSISWAEILAKPSDYVMLFRPSLMRYDFGGAMPTNARCLYSCWHGYLGQPEWKDMLVNLKHAGGDLIECHTSGHIHVEDWVKLIKKLNPRTIIPIHTQRPEEYRRTFENAKVMEDAQCVEIE